MSKEGFDNETDICNYLNKKKVSQLNPNMKKFIESIFSKVNNNSIIICDKQGGQNKGDIIISCNKKKIIVSIKIGTGNSVHQEPVEPFIKFLKEKFNLNNELADKIRFFIWGDDTLDGTGKISNRLSAPQLKKNHSQLIDDIKNFFEENKKELIERFVLMGPKSLYRPDYIYYGNIQSGIWKDADNLLIWLCLKENESNGAIPVGRLTFQAWNRNINGGNKSEHKRGVIQLKWGSIGEDLEII